LAAKLIVAFIFEKAFDSKEAISKEAVINYSVPLIIVRRLAKGQKLTTTKDIFL
jgi:hypothetical protein